jgi:hypothetical protein
MTRERYPPPVDVVPDPAPYTDRTGRMPVARSAIETDSARRYDEEAVSTARCLALAFVLWPQCP